MGRGEGPARSGRGTLALGEVHGWLLRGASQEVKEGSLPRAARGEGGEGQSAGLTFPSVERQWARVLLCLGSSVSSGSPSH